MPETCSSIKFTFIFCCIATITGCGGSADIASSPQSVPVVDAGVVPPTLGTPSTPASNVPPVLDGEPLVQVSVGEAYSFTPSVTDANGDAVTFSATNVPRWAHFDETTGSLSGTPTAADVSSYPNILISANDGQASSTLASFTITVVDSATGSASISWFPPTQNTDGSTLTNLAGYLIHYGRNSSSLNGKVKISNPSVSRYLLGNLTTGKWHFAVSAINTHGVESSLSDVASKTIF